VLVDFDRLLENECRLRLYILLSVCLISENLNLHLYPLIFIWWNFNGVPSSLAFGHFNVYLEIESSIISDSPPMEMWLSAKVTVLVFLLVALNSVFSQLTVIFFIVILSFF
jgi:hypothetical protein